MSEDVVGEAGSGTSGGVWEQSAGLRWQLVGEQEERIPSRSRSSSRRDGPVDPGLSIQVTCGVDRCPPLRSHFHWSKFSGFLGQFH